MNTMDTNEDFIAKMKDRFITNIMSRGEDNTSEWCDQLIEESNSMNVVVLIHLSIALRQALDVTDGWRQYGWVSQPEIPAFWE